MSKLILLFILLLPVTSLGQESLMPRGDFWDKPGFFLVRIGFISTSNFVLDGRSEETQPGFSFGAAMEWRVARLWHAGVGVDVHRAHLSDSGQYFIDFTGSIKRMFFDKPSRIGLRPGLTIGYGVMDYFWGFGSVRIDRTRYMTWKGSFETIFFNRGRVAPYLEFGLFGAAFGGNRSHNINFGPSTYFRAGVMF